MSLVGYQVVEGLQKQVERVMWNGMQPLAIKDTYLIIDRTVQDIFPGLGGIVEDTVVVVPHVPRNIPQFFNQFHCPAFA